MSPLKFFVGVGLLFVAGITSSQAYFEAVEMAESPTVKQNRFYPMWEAGSTLSEVFYGVPVKLYRPTKDQQKKWFHIVRMFVEDVTEKDIGGYARIFQPHGLIHPSILRDGREFFRIFWKDKVNNERRVTDDMDILAIGSAGKWIEVWVRFVEMDRYPSMCKTNYVAMLIEENEDNEPYLADFKVLGRTPTGKSTEEFLQETIGLRKFAVQPDMKAKTKAKKANLKLR